MTSFWSERSDYRRLYSSDEIYVSKLMADYYDIELKHTPQQEINSPLPVGNDPIEAAPKHEFDGFIKTNVGGESRSGILTHPYLMTGLSYHRTTSPIHRGVFVARRLLGRTLKQPPENFEPLKEDFDPTMTTRERVAHQTQDKSCQTCHSFINPLGFSLESYDAVGAIRSIEKDKPIDTKSIYKTETDEAIELNGPRDLANYLVENTKARRNFIKHIFQHLVKHAPSAYGPETLDLLDRSFVKNQFSIKKLIVDIAKLTALHGTEAAKKLELVKPQPALPNATDVQAEIEVGGN